MKFSNSKVAFLLLVKVIAGMMIFLFNSSYVYSITSMQLNSDLNNIKSKIVNVNQDISHKQHQKQNLVQAISDSQNALKQTQALTNKLQNDRLEDLSQVKQISKALLQVQDQATKATFNVNLQINSIYRQIVAFNNTPDSVLSSDPSVKSRTKEYLIALVMQQKAQLDQLQKELTMLKLENVKLQQRILYLNSKLNAVAHQHAKYSKIEHDNSLKAENLATQITHDNSQLDVLKAREAHLNQLMEQIIAAESKQKMIVDQAKKSHTSQTIAKAKISEDAHQPLASSGTIFSGRPHAYPVQAPVLEGYGSTHNGNKTNGILFGTKLGQSVVAVSSGTVMYASVLPGFGQVVIVDHENDFMSIYSGIVSEVHRGQHVNMGQIIASIGDSHSQPMGGMYFELRKLGKPVNPDTLTN